MRILIAEDDQVLADGVLRALRASGMGPCSTPVPMRAPSKITLRISAACLYSTIQS